MPARSTSGMMDLTIRVMEQEKEVKGKIGEQVKATGIYVCDNCGHYQVFEKHDEFEECTSCYEPDITWEPEA